MSAAALPKTMRSMRIIAIPLTRPNNVKPSSNPHASRILTYYHFQISSPPPAPKTAGEGKGKGRWIPEGGVVKWATGKAADAWAGFGKAKEGSWKLRVYQSGERLVDRMDFEELALKGIDPSLGPSIAGAGLAGKEEKKEKAKGPKLTIPLIHPPSIHSGAASLAHLKALLAYRTPRHRKGFFTWMIIAPFTAPFMIIPIIPNLPFFFCVWRSWSHYRAYRASQYLQSLLDSDAIVPEASRALDDVYTKFGPRPTVPSQEKGEAKKEKETQHSVLLTRDAVPAMLTLFGLKAGAEADMYRAVEQARARVNSGRVKL